MNGKGVVGFKKKKKIYEYHLHYSPQLSRKAIQDVIV